MNLTYDIDRKFEIYKCDIYGIEYEGIVYFRFFEYVWVYFDEGGIVKVEGDMLSKLEDKFQDVSKSFFKRND